MEDADDGAGVGPAGLLEADIPDEARYTMRIDPAEVCAEQGRSGGAGVFIRAADPAEDVDREGQQVLV